MLLLADKEELIPHLLGGSIDMEEKIVKHDKRILYVVAPWNLLQGSYLIVPLKLQSTSET